MNCEICQQPIPTARLQAVPETTRCVKCQSSQDTRVKGRVVYDHKTAGAVEVLSPQAFDAAQRADPRSPGKGCQTGSGAAGSASGEDRAPARDRFETFSGRVPNHVECQAIITEMEDFRGLEPFERSFIDSNLDRRTFSDKQKIVLAKLAKTYELKSWRP